MPGWLSSVVFVSPTHNTAPAYHRATLRFPAARVLKAANRTLDQSPFASSSRPVLQTEPCAWTRPGVSLLHLMFGKHGYPGEVSPGGWQAQVGDLMVQL